MTEPRDPPGPLAPADADLIADRVVQRLVDALTDRDTVDRVTDAWAGSLDRVIGRGIRRLAGTVVMALLLWGAVKFEVLGKLLGIKG